MGMSSRIKRCGSVQITVTPSIIMLVLAVVTSMAKAIPNPGILMLKRRSDRAIARNTIGRLTNEAAMHAAKVMAQPTGARAVASVMKP